MACQEPPSFTALCASLNSHMESSLADAESLLSAVGQPPPRAATATALSPLERRVCTTRSASAELAGTIAFARVWRFVRIGHGLSTAQHESSLAEFEKIEDHVKEVEEELRRLRSRHR